jgi:hypothetical protein
MVIVVAGVSDNKGYGLATERLQSCEGAMWRSDDERESVGLIQQTG